MQKIQVLSPSIFNRIAAGEVVERPASIVKELIENSIDAQASIISVAIEGGGIKKISISDNGIGIPEDQLKTAFLPHATSKISSTQDLDAIATLGFRGEALPSIASVCKITMRTKPQIQELACEICIENGNILHLMPKGSANGTYITIEDVFKNLPARQKFLKSSRQEEAEISHLMTRMALANPHISIKYSCDGSTVFQTDGTDLKSALYKIYGNDALSNCFYVEKTTNDCSFWGFFGQPHYSKPNRTYQTVCINGRYVQSSQLSYAIYEAYAPYLMKRQYPFFVMHLQLEHDKIDVNVHPNKLEVRINNIENITNIIQSTLQKQLLTEFSIPKVTLHEPQKTLHSTAQMQESTPIKSFNIFSSRVSEPTAIAQKLNTHSVQNPSVPPQQAQPVQQEMHMVQPPQTIGTAFNTYIFLEHKDTLYVIDQHAAHERILYDKFMHQYESKALCIQQMLVPFVFDTNRLEYEFLQANLQIYHDLGFDIQPFGENCFKINALPACFIDMKLKEFLSEVLSVSHKTHVTQKYISDLIATKACKAAVKGGDVLSNQELSNLIDSFTEHTVLLCPHGRPIVVALSKTQIEKWFRRQV